MFELGPFEYQFKNSSKKIFCTKKINIKNKEIVLISGMSGAGKSTLLQIIKGLIPHYSTGMFTGNMPFSKKEKNDQGSGQLQPEIVFLFQNPFSQLIYPNVAEEFFFTMENFNFTKEQMDFKRLELESSFNLDSIWNKKTAELSHGECQKLVLASLLAIDPQILLLDEPTAFLDPVARASFYLWLKKIKGQYTVILIDHHFDEVLPIVDKILDVASNGSISEVNGDYRAKFGVENHLLNQEINLKKSNNIHLSLAHINYHHAGQKKLLEDISFSASSGEIVVIKGENGKGKSTLFKIIAGLIRPLRGEIQIKKNGIELPLKKYTKEIGFIFQNPEAHFFFDTIAEELKSISDQSQVDVLLKMFFENIDLNRSPFLLSEGEKRRLGILITVLQEKSILLYDEPTFGQDQSSIFKIKELILSLKNMGKIQVIISHDEAFINSLPTKIYLLSNGQLEIQE
ncbi:MAG: ABC transporter ATP-binding protein [Bacteriovorax sp.]|nr:ABC transporter ATP-binding protein [Bacteriovorax sp.]